MTNLSSTALLNVDVQPGKPPVLRVEAVGEAARWAADYRDELRALVAEHGALLVCGLGLRDVAQIDAVFRQLGNLMTETEAFAPRQSYAQGVYSASKWPPNQQMCMHHELSYALGVPNLMLFACVVPSASGGATPVADAAAVLEALPPELVERFELLGWLLIRNYNNEIGASLADAFGTHDRTAIESYCRANAIDFEWHESGLRTRQRRNAVVRHPRTGRRCWFNQIAFLSEWTMAVELREYLLDVFQVINDVYEAHTVREPWQAGDLLVVDNLRAAHGREAFEGPREVVVALAE